MDQIAQQDISQQSLPSQDFVEMINRIEGSRDTTPPKAVESPKTEMIMVDTPIGPVPFPKSAQTLPDGIQKIGEPLQDAVKKEPEEIKLEYHFTGDCPKHMTQVSTLTAEVNGKCIAFAFCIECNKNIYSKMVPLLTKTYFEDISVKPKRMFTRKKKEAQE